MNGHDSNPEYNAAKGVKLMGTTKLRAALLVFALRFPILATTQTMDAHHQNVMPAIPLKEPMATPTQPGQSAFAAIQEIVAIL